ncbi:tetratricopeptide repeat protein [Vogesella indigofera]|uniref:Tetratricopeptide repeat protein n=1 Tax=Vogesella indigofera TaxID=45465 RepID=A0ABT5I8S7_VOGIN|nr:hypothetical protein [Vogesella indigofera]MDC7692427.1 hypothetical protein [Vogesella indigofera]
MLPLHPALRLSLLAAALVAANLVHAEVPAGSPFTPEQQQLIRQLSASEVKAATPEIASEAASSVAKTIAGEKQAIEVAKDALEVGRKSVDWWLSNISVWLGGLGLLIAVAGIGIPLWMGRKQKVEWQEKLNLLTQKMQEAETAQQQAKAAQQAAEQHAQEIEELLTHARNKTSLIPKADEITGKLSVEVLEKLRNEKPPQVVKLIEQAWDAHRRKDWKTAKPLWGLLSLIEGHDSNVWFNLGFTLAHMNSDWETVASCFERSHLLEPNPDALNNWGNALGNLAKNLPCKEEKEHGFAQACKKFAEATHIKPDYANAYNNWGCMLVHWGHVLSGQHREVKLQEAEGALLKAKELGDKNFYNLACLRAMQHRPDEARALLLETRNNDSLPNFALLSTDQDLGSLRELDWFKELLEDVRQQEAGKSASPG